MRVGEAIGLRWKNVHLDVENPYIDIVETVVVAKDRSSDSDKRTAIIQDSCKTARSTRRLPLKKKAAEYLRKQKEHRYYGEEYFVFNTTDSSKPTPVGDSTLRRAFGKIQENAGVDKDNQKGMHSLRHTFATRLNEANVSAITLAGLMGHSSIDVTKIYVDNTEKAMRDAIRQIDNGE